MPSSTTALRVRSSERTLQPKWACKARTSSSISGPSMDPTPSFHREQSSSSFSHLMTIPFASKSPLIPQPFYKSHRVAGRPLHHSLIGLIWMGCRIRMWITEKRLFWSVTMCLKLIYKRRFVTHPSECKIHLQFFSRWAWAYADQFSRWASEAAPSSASVETNYFNMWRNSSRGSPPELGRRNLLSCFPKKREPFGWFQNRLSSSMVALKPVYHGSHGGRSHPPQQ